MKPLENHKNRTEKETTHFSTSFICDFEKRWNEVIGVLKRSKADLAKIIIVANEEKGTKHGRTVSDK